jgi:hypothetical protein
VARGLRACSGRWPLRSPARCRLPGSNPGDFPRTLFWPASGIRASDAARGGDEACAESGHLGTDFVGRVPPPAADRSTTHREAQPNAPTTFGSGTSTAPIGTWGCSVAPPLTIALKSELMRESSYFPGRNLRSGCATYIEFHDLGSPDRVFCRTRNQEHSLLDPSGRSCWPGCKPRF